MKKLLKVSGIILGILALAVGIGICYLWYEFQYKRTEIMESSEGAYTLTVYQTGEPGWPFGPVDGEFVLREGRRKRNTCDFTVHNDGGGLSEGNTRVKWTKDGVRILVCGEEQEDMLYFLGFDGSSYHEAAGPWYTDEEVIASVKEMYGAETEFQKKENSVYLFSAKTDEPWAGSFYFYVEQIRDKLTDNYRKARFRYVSDDFFEKRGMRIEWQEKGLGAETGYIPAFWLSSGYDRDVMNFCENFCDYLEFCMEQESFFQVSGNFPVFTMTVAGHCFVYEPSADIGEYDRILMYNELYARIDEVLHKQKEDSTEGESSKEKADTKVSREVIEYYMSLDPACSFLTDTGLEYRMVAVDRALGSSFYVLIGVKEQGTKCDFVNPDPYNGSGGESRWITFVDDKLGFSCLAHAAGSYGSLYLTQDGGESWEITEYPSARAKLPDGTYYNPFVMPQKVYEEDGILYMEAGQGADGDHYDEELGFCHGLYQSSDRGKNWKFVRKIAVSGD